MGQTTHQKLNLDFLRSERSGQVASFGRSEIDDMLAEDRWGIDLVTVCALGNNQLVATTRWPRPVNEREKLILVAQALIGLVDCGYLSYPDYIQIGHETTYFKPFFERAIKAYLDADAEYVPDMDVREDFLETRVARARTAHHILRDLTEKRVTIGMLPPNQ